MYSLIRHLSINQPIRPYDLHPEDEIKEILKSSNPSQSRLLELFSILDGVKGLQPQIKSQILRVFCHGPITDSTFGVIKQLILDGVDVNELDSSGNGPLDYFLERGGNLTKVFNDADVNFEKLGISEYANNRHSKMDWEYYPHDRTGTFLLALCASQTRNVILGSPILSFLQGRKLQVIAQVFESELSKTNREEQEGQLVAIMTNLSNGQIAYILENLSPHARENLGRHMYKHNWIFPYLVHGIVYESLCINKHFDVKLNLKVLELQNFQVEKDKIGSLTANSHQNIIFRLRRIIKQLERYSLFCNDSKLQKMLKEDKDTFERVLKEKSFDKSIEKELYPNTLLMSSNPYDIAKYQALKAVIKTLPNFALHLDDLDLHWDMICKIVFDVFDMSRLPELPQTSDDRAIWIVEAQKVLQNQVRSSFNEHNITKINDLSSWRLQGIIRNFNRLATQDSSSVRYKTPRAGPVFDQSNFPPLRK